MATAGGLVFGSNASSFFALDAQKGDLLWHFEAGGTIDANPISFMSAGKQYVVIAAGGHGKLGTKQGDYVIAFALP